MTWASQDQEFRTYAEQVLTPFELEAYALWLTPGNGYRTVGHYLGISKSAARDRIDRALTKLSKYEEVA